MNDQLEIGGDLQDEYEAIQAAEADERDTAWSESPNLLGPITEAELDAWAERWTDLVEVGEEIDGTKIWEFV